MRNNKITNVPQPARSILRGYPDIEGVASLHDRYLEAVTSGDDAAIQEAQQHIETLLDGETRFSSSVTVLSSQRRTGSSVNEGGRHSTYTILVLLGY